VRILIVDGKSFVAELVKLALEADGHECATAKSFDGATAIVDAMPIDLVTVNLAVDGRSSLDWLEEISLAHPALAGRLFILSERRLDEHEMLRVRAAGARVVHKPFTLEELRQTLTVIAPPEPHPKPPRPPAAEPEA